MNSISERHALPKSSPASGAQGAQDSGVSISGAFGGITADLLVQSGLACSPLPGHAGAPREVRPDLQRQEPIDLGPALSMQTFLEIFDIFLSSDEVDGLLPVPSLWHPMVIEAIKELVRNATSTASPPPSTRRTRGKRPSHTARNTTSRSSNPPRRRSGARRTSRHHCLAATRRDAR